MLKIESGTPCPQLDFQEASQLCMKCMMLFILGDKGRAGKEQKAQWRSQSFQQKTIHISTVTAVKSQDGDTSKWVETREIFCAANRNTS